VSDIDKGFVMLLQSFKT